MKHWVAPQRRFLFLQGPPGPFFRLLGTALEGLGAGIYRINLNGGDRYDWRDASADYRGSLARWPLFVDRFMREHRITDLILYGDCRPMHLDAHRMAKLRRVRIHVMEEGYIRPDWMTFEPDGVNGYSTLRRDPAWLLQEAAQLPPVPDLPPITASFKRRAKDSYWHYHRIVTGLVRFPFYRTHRHGMIIVEGFGWIAKFLRKGRRRRMAENVLQRLGEAPFFLFPLQLNSDFQIRIHSPFETMVSAAEYVIDSFARHAPPNARLLVKEHPLENSFLNWHRRVGKLARKYGVADRILHIDGGDLIALSAASRGVVCVNSTSGTLALNTGTPVIVLGDALYDIAGVTHQGLLDAFWDAPQPPDPRIYEAFRRVLHAHCLVRGGVASESAIDTLVDSVVERLFGAAETNRVVQISDAR